MPKLSAAVLAASLILAPAPAMAIQCGDHKELAKHLNDKFSERLSSVGRDARGRVVEFYRSEVGSWTLVLVLPEGPACVLTAGSDWQDMPTRPRGEDV